MFYVYIWKVYNVSQILYYRKKGSNKWNIFNDILLSLRIKYLFSKRFNDLGQKHNEIIKIPYSL